MVRNGLAVTILSLSFTQTMYTTTLENIKENQQQEAVITTTTTAADMESMYWVSCWVKAALGECLVLRGS